MFSIFTIYVLIIFFLNFFIIYYIYRQYSSSCFFMIIILHINFFYSFVSQSLYIYFFLITNFVLFFCFSIFEFKIKYPIIYIFKNKKHGNLKHPFSIVSYSTYTHCLTKIIYSKMCLKYHKYLTVFTHIHSPAPPI